MSITPMSTVADIARNIGRKVNLSEICRGMDMSAYSRRLYDGSTMKLLHNYSEVDCIVMKNGKVLTAKGKFVESPNEANRLVSKIFHRYMANMKSEDPVNFYKYD